jgi:hypothetical protein
MGDREDRIALDPLEKRETLRQVPRLVEGLYSKG